MTDTFILGVLGRQEIRVQFPHLKAFYVAAENAASEDCCGVGAVVSKVCESARQSILSMPAHDIQRLKTALGLSGRVLLSNSANPVSV